MIYVFEDYSLDPNRRELRREGQLVSVEPQVFDLLHHLIRQREQVVSKDDLIVAVWNGRIVSESTLTSRITEARHAIGDNGEAQRLIRTIPRKGHRFVGEVNEKANSPHASETAASGTVSLPLPDKPSIVVLPFTNLSGDPAQDYFADGMVEDITIALGRLPWLFVIGSGSAFTYKNAATDLRRIGTELGVRYALSGSIRKESNRVRITVQLSDTSHGGHVWADRFDGELDNIFEMQDRVAVHVSTTIAPALQSAEVRRAERKPTENLTAYDLYLRASRHVRDGVERNRESLRQLKRAIELDPGYGGAYGLAAFCYFWQKVFGWVAPNDPSLDDGVKLARNAASHGEEDSEALWMAAQALIMLAGDLDQAVELVEKSIALNPNSPSAFWTSCLVHAFMGQSDRALEHSALAHRLNPRDPLSSTHANAAALATFFAQRYEECSTMVDRVLAREPLFPPALRLKVAVSGQLNQLDQGHVFVEKLRCVNPHASVTTIRDYYAAPLKQNEAGLERFLEGLRRSGLPEK